MGLEELAAKVRELMRGPVGGLVERRILEFKSFRRRPPEEWFSELCFCILTANSSARTGMRIQSDLGPRGFLELEEGELAERLRALGHRFYATRAKYIVQARRLYPVLKDRVLSFKSGPEARDWLVGEVKGFGMKEASHFLRNVGFDDVAIVDRHILNVLVEHGVVERPRSMTRRRYLEIEGALRELATIVNTTLSRLDLFLWYMKTGEVLK